MCYAVLLQTMYKFCDSVALAVQPGAAQSSRRQDCYNCPQPESSRQLIIPHGKVESASHRLEAPRNGSCNCKTF